jgi:hypothetical protein
MRQPSFSDIEYGLRKRTTKREEFLKAVVISSLGTNGFHPIFHNESPAYEIY